MEKVVQILQSIRPEFDFSDAKNIISDGMIDSFDLMILVSELDSAYKISIPGEEIIPENFESIDSINKFLRKCGVKE